MVLKIIDATEIKSGTNLIIDGTPCTVRSIDISRPGKHGHAKIKVEAIGILTGQKKVFVAPGHDKFDVPFVDKRKAQVLTIGDKVNVMDLENFESFDVNCSEEIKNQLESNSNVEYWDVEGEKIIKRKL